jgi:hypothetical protein
MASDKVPAKPGQNVGLYYHQVSKDMVIGSYTGTTGVTKKGGRTGKIIRKGH